VLTAYIPMLMDTGGNAGSQASVSVIRGLSLHEIRFNQLVLVIWKEIRVAVICGVTLAGANFLKLLFFDRIPVGCRGGRLHDSCLHRHLREDDRLRSADDRGQDRL
jgi:Mg/Co/Ni transporter MgtE